MRKLAIAVAGAGLALSGATASAASISSLIQNYIALNGGNPVLVSYEDDDRTTVIVDAGQQGILDTGDVLFGVFEMSTVEKETAPFVTTAIGNAAYSELTGVYAIQVTSTAGNSGSGWQWTFGPEATFQSTYGTGAMAAVYEDPANNSSFAPFNPAPPPTGSGLTDGSLYAVLGLTDASTFWTTNSVSVGSFGHTNSFATIGTYPATLKFAAGDLSLDRIIGGPAGPAITDLYVIQDNIFNSEFSGAIELYGGIDGYPVSSKTTFKTTVETVIPTPAAVWAGMALLGGLAVRRFRKA